MHGGAIMMLLSATAVPRRQTVEWTSENGKGYSVLVTPSLYHSSGIIEVYDII
jgi:alpha-ribazole phosphatase